MALNWIELKGISFSLKIKNEKTFGIIMNISTIISILSRISMLIKPKIFANTSGLIRYDNLIFYIEFLQDSLI